MDIENKLIANYKKLGNRKAWLHLLTTALILEKNRDNTETDELVKINQVIELLNIRQDLHDEDVSEITAEVEEITSNMDNEY